MSPRFCGLKSACLKRHDQGFFAIGSSGRANRKSNGSYRMKSSTSTSLTVTVRAGVILKRT